jgi:hypothetical protein
MEYYLALKKDILSYVNMDEPRGTILSEKKKKQSQEEKSTT